jgi:hypothetical protein
MPSKLLHDPRMLLLSILVPALLIGMWVSDAKERLVLTDDGIEYRFALPGRLRRLLRLRPDWRLTWSDIRSIELVKPTGSQKLRWRLVLKATSEAKTIEPLNWVVARSAQPVVEPKLSVFGIYNNAAEAAVQQHPVVKALAARGYLAKR